MPIEFHCPHCQKFLSTSEDKAGRKAKCPGCGETIAVPAVQQAEGEFTSAVASDVADDRPKKSCPMCGETILAAATRCRFCGEEFGVGATGEITPTQIDAGDVLGTTWRIYMNHLGMVIAATLIVGVLNMLVGLPRAAITLGAGVAAQNNPQNEGALVAAQAVGLLLMLVEWAAQIFFGTGLAIFNLKVARGDEPALGDLFSGGRFFLRALGSTFVYTIAVVVGVFACVVPGIYVALMWQPFLYVLVGEDTPGLQMLERARTYTNGNKGQLLVLAFAGMGLFILGLLMLCVGLLFTMPYFSLALAVAYLKMTGQRTGDPAPAQA